MDSDKIIWTKNLNNVKTYCAWNIEFSSYLEARDYIYRILKLGKYKPADSLYNIIDPNINGSIYDISDSTKYDTKLDFS